MSSIFVPDQVSESNNFQRVEIKLLIDFMQELKLVFYQNHWSVKEYKPK